MQHLQSEACARSGTLPPLRAGVELAKFCHADGILGGSLLDGSMFHGAAKKKTPTAPQQPYSLIR
jgi:hypothetical protein